MSEDNRELVAEIEAAIGCGERAKAEVATVVDSLRFAGKACKDAERVSFSVIDLFPDAPEMPSGPPPGRNPGNVGKLLRMGVLRESPDVRWFDLLGGVQLYFHVPKLTAKEIVDIRVCWLRTEAAVTGGPWPCWPMRP